MPFPSPGDLPNPGIEPTSPALAGRFFTTEPPGKPSNTVLELSILSSLYFYKPKTSLLKKKSIQFLKGSENKKRFPSGSVVKNLPAKQENRVQYVGQEDPLEKEMATHSSILA